MNYFEDFEFKDLFSRSLKIMSSLDTEFARDPNYNSKDVIATMDVDSLDIKYKYNSHGYRCEEFNNQPILTLGCSITHGHGLDLEHTWPYMISQKMGLTYANLGKGGDSLQAQVIKAFQYFKEIGHPKYIFALFPISRLEFPFVRGYLERHSGLITPSIHKKIVACFLNTPVEDLDKISKMPYNPDKILPTHVAIFYNLMFAQILDQYCLSNNIKFFWTIYEWNSSDIIDNQVKNLINMKSYFNDLSWFGNSMECHKELSDHPTFEWAADDEKMKKNNMRGHPGWHSHLHLSENLYDIVDKQEL